MDYYNSYYNKSLGEVVTSIKKMWIFFKQIRLTVLDSIYASPQSYILHVQKK